MPPRKPRYKPERPFRGPRLPADLIKLMLTEGATRQVDAAIDALGRGDFDVALTLAGAAEGMIKREGIHLFSFLRESARANAAYAEPKDGFPPSIRSATG
jgi:hypothetical protein